MPILRGGTTTVLVDVYPQRDGRIVENLTADDFQVLEDGKPQHIDVAEFVRIAPSPPEAVRRDPDGLREMYAAAANPRNRVFVAFLDEFHTTLAGSNAIRRPLLDLIDRAVGQDDLIGLMTARMRPRDLTLGRERRAIEEQLTRFWTWGERQRTTSERSDPMEDSLQQCFHTRFTGATLEPWLVDEGGVQRYLDEVLIERRREEQTLRALGDLVQFLGGLREARTTLILVSDGWVLFGPNRALAGELGRDSAIPQRRGQRWSDDGQARSGRAGHAVDVRAMRRGIRPPHRHRQRPQVSRHHHRRQPRQRELLSRGDRRDWPSSIPR